jgi:hypothetical protein
LTVVVPTYKTVVTIQRKSGIDRDAVQNVFHLAAPSGAPSSTDFGNAMGHIKNFYDDIASALSSCLSVAPNSILVEFTKLTAEKPAPGTGLGPPQSAGTVSFATGPVTVGLPSEVSACLTLDGTVITDAEEGPGGIRPASRKRNRKYIGPLSVNASTAESVTLEPKLTSQVRALIIQAFLEELVTGLESKGWLPMVFSPTLWSVLPILSVWIDNAFDTQRRRGEDATSRQTDPMPAMALQAFIAKHHELGVHLEHNSMGNLVRV